MLETDVAHPERYCDIVIQLIMGGGKTSVIATILLYLAACRQGRLSFFIVPPSLFQTVKSNLGESLTKAFGKDILALNMMREDFTQHKLQKTYNQLLQARENSQPVIISAITLQGLELTLSLIRKLKTYILAEESAEQKQSIKTLEQKCTLISIILTLTSENADGLLDEVDLILDSFQEVNFVDGEKVQVNPALNHLLKAIFEAFISDQLIIETLPNKPTLAAY